MKVVLFCGGYGMRMRDGQSDVPKPMTTVGPRPLIWHVMRYYAHFGHKDFVLCLGYGAHHIKDYFLHYDETASNDFVLSGGKVRLLGSDIADWKITFVHTGLTSPIGERLRRVREHVEDEEMFLANYADVLTDLPLDDMVARFRAQPDKVGALLAVPPQSAFHCVDVDDDDSVASITTLQQMPLWENGDLVTDGAMVLAKEGRMMAYPYNGFWQPADTVKERTALEAAYQGGTRPWMLWDRGRSGADRDPLQATIAAMRDTHHER
jgi:glucose-1-phosphate cytidylyltransferase